MTARSLPSQEYLRECFDYDPETGVLIWRERPVGHFIAPKRGADIIARAWNKKMSGTQAGAVSATPTGKRYIKLGLGGNGRTVNAHSVIWKLVTGYEPLNEIDHRDGDGTNNRWDNLRDATHAQNGANHPGWRDRYLPKGVSRADKRFRARISVRGEVTMLGRFDTPEEAHAAYCEAAERLHG